MKKEKRRRYGLTLALALLFSLFFYTFTTPLGPIIGSDNAIYMTMGTALANGYAPYTEVFDHKGPLLFILQWIPQALGGGYSTLAIFVQQVIFLVACLMLIGRIADQFDAPVLPAQLAYLALNCRLVGGGNLTEEYANLFTLAGIFLMLMTFKNGIPEKTDGLLLRAGILGALTMACFMIRANNALVLCAMVAGLAVGMIAARRFSGLLRCVVGFLVGATLAALPVGIWLAANGALKESIYGSILHNMMYSNTGGAGRLDALLHMTYGHTAILMAIFSLCGAALLLRRNMPLSMAMVAGAAAGGLSAFISRKFYDHYLILGTPLAVTGICMLLGCGIFRKKWRRAVLSVCVCAVCMIHLGSQGEKINQGRVAEYSGMDTFFADAQELMAQVPTQERNELFAYRVEPKWYVAAEAMPYMRFYFLQETLGQADPAVMDEIVETFENDPPKWLVIYYQRAFSPAYDARVQEIFNTQYEFVDARGQYQLLRLKENPS